jgi:glycosidase
MPIHPVGVMKRKGTLGSPYSVRDYNAVNPEFGTLDDFRQLLNRAHTLGFRLIIDLVANHTAWDSKLIQEHPEWFTHDSTGTIVPPIPDWSDVADLDYSQPGLRRYMIEMMKYWVRDIGIDGFRCDVSEMVPSDFWESARAALDEIKPVMMLSEGAYPEHHLKAFDLTYDWNLYHAIAPVLAGTSTARELDRVLALQELIFPWNSLHLRFSSNHDENAWDKADVDKFGTAGAKLAAVLVNTLPGVPLLYNGQEVGNPVKLALFEKIPINWQARNNFREFYTKLFALRASHPALTGNTMIRIPSSNDRRVYAFVRLAAADTLLAVFNFAESEFRGTLNFSNTLLRIESSVTLTDLFSEKSSAINIDLFGTLPLTVPATGFVLYQVSRSPIR